MGYRELLNTILDLSRGMLEKAKAGDWAEVQAAEKQRQVLVEQSNGLPADEQEAKVASDMIQTILEINEQIMSLSRKHLAVCQQAFEDVNKGRRAVKAYGG